MFGVPFENPYAGTENPFPQAFAPFNAPSNSTFILPLGPVWRFLQRIQAELYGILQFHTGTGSMGWSSPARQLCRESREAPLLQLRPELRPLCLLGPLRGTSSSAVPSRISAVSWLRTPGAIRVITRCNSPLNAACPDGFSFEANYTWSKAIDEFSEDTVPGQSASIPIPLDRRAGRAVADFDNTHRLVSSWVWQLPAFKSAPASARAFIGGWETARHCDYAQWLPLLRAFRQRSFAQWRRQRFRRHRRRSESSFRPFESRQIARYFNTSRFRCRGAGNLRQCSAKPAPRTGIDQLRSFGHEEYSHTGKHPHAVPRRVLQCI